MISITKKQPWLQLAIVVAVGFLVNLGLFAYSLYLERGLANSYLIVNLGLALIPLCLSWRLVVALKRKRWSDWEPLILTFAWIIFLPNSFYMISDFIHLQYMSSSVILYNSLMFSSFIFLAVAMGLISLYQVHQELRKRVYANTAVIFVILILIGCCFAIYLGRDLRWNSWDVVTNPAGLLFDISNLILRPQTYKTMFQTIISFFVVIATAYFLSWQASRLLWHKGVNDLAIHLKQRQNK